jgi:tryptophan-rich sensory protein
MYTGLLLIVTQNLISHASALLFYDKSAYFTTGSRGILTLTGFILFNNGTSDYQKELVNPDWKSSRTDIGDIFTLNLPIIGIILVIILLNFLRNMALYIILVLGFYWLIILFILYKDLKLFKKIAYQNIILKFRRFFVSGIRIAAFFYTIILIIIYFPRNNDESTWLGRNPTIEYLIFSFDIFCLIMALMIYLTISLPRWLRLLFRISDQDYYLSRDPRIDYHWHRIDREVLTIDTDIFDPDRFSNALNKPNNLLLHDIPEINDEDQPSLNAALEILSTHYNAKEFLSVNTIQEAYVKTYVLPNSNVLTISTRANSESLLGIKILKDNYGFEISLDNNLTINEFDYLDHNFCYAFISALPSPWNKKLRLWTLLCQARAIYQLSRFIMNHGTYLKDYAGTHVLLLILKFPVSNGEILPIPSSDISPDMPDEEYLKYF